MGGVPSSRIQQINAEIAAKQNAELREAVEDFAEHAYAEGSKVDGLKLILNNPRARAAFIKFLNTENDGENFGFFQEMERLRNASPAELAEGAKALVEQYKKPAEEAEVDVANNVIGSIDAIFAGAEPPSSAEIMESVESAMNETIVIMALSAFPSFIGSESYKEWREAELNSSTAIVNADGVAAAPAPTASTVKFTDAVVVAAATGPPSEQTFASSSAAFIEPTAVERLFGSGSWLATLLGAAEALPICVTLADASPTNPGFPLIYVNRVFESVTGYKRERIRGTNCKFLQKDKSERDSIALLSNALANAQPVKVAITNFTSDGKPFKNLLAMKPIFDMDGKYRYVVGVQFDISAPGSNAKVMKMVDSLLSLLPNVAPTGETI
uniref:Putative LOV domain-containing protein n=1 Tax=Synura petersenii TaxID=52555 RepID=A0A126WWW1_9STRA|nr:putative LOV domain-containing protein [Synura petersenii]